MQKEFEDLSAKLKETEDSLTKEKSEKEELKETFANYKEETDQQIRDTREDVHKLAEVTRQVS